MRLLLLVLLMSKASHAQMPPRIEITEPELRAHRLNRVDWIRIADAQPFQSLQLQIEVDEAGAVTNVRITEGPLALNTQAIALAQSWRYRPFERNGKAIPATFAEYVSILPPELPVRNDIPFPNVRDWASIRITLERTACFGACPVYRVQIDGQGKVVFTERSPLQQERYRHISRQEVENLLEVFRRANFFSLDPEYVLEVTDLPACIITVSIDGRVMSIRDYGGMQMGMPASVREVENAIDEAAGTSDWLH